MSYTQSLTTEIEYLKGIGPLRASILKKELNIFTFGDLLDHFPFRYVDRTKIYRISEINSDAAYIQLKGKLSHLQEIGEGKGKRLIANLKDDSGELELVWFKGLKWVKNALKPGFEYIVFGKPSVFRNTYNMIHPEMELVIPNMPTTMQMKFQPVYSSTEKLTAKGLDSKGILKLQQRCLEAVGHLIFEILPDSILLKFKLVSRKEAYQSIHFPYQLDQLEKARTRLKFEELFVLQYQLLLYKNQREIAKKGFILPRIGNYFNEFYKNILPFELTNAQKKVIKEIRSDLTSGNHMNRMLQGDVGSGKTIVALMSMLIALDNGMQACLMAPTEILATQHYNNIKNMVGPLGIKIRLLTGSTKTAKRKLIDQELTDGSLHIIIGTHALLEDKVVFDNLGLAIIDEQHRFGVAQRAKLWKKNTTPPHVLIMTATPIPRTLAMTFYGDLDNSVIDEMPPGRKEIITRHYYENSRLKVFGQIKKIIEEGRQVYIVYPLIEESEKLDYKNLMEGYDIISREFPRPHYQLGIVHGKMKSEDKESEMQRFKNGELHILVSTTVIEVGVDVPNATVMVIESAEKFGLSQLHQLRGRVGRGSNQSFCILMTSHKLTNEAKIRMETMVATNDGFKIAEVDLKLRGPGDITGTQQSGLMNFKLANLASDHQIIKSARMAAKDLIDDDLNLEKEGNRKFKAFYQEFQKHHINWGEIS